MSLLKNKRFKYLLSAYTLSVFVDSVVFMTLIKWIEIKSGEQNLFTLFYICFYLPAALFSFAIGTWVEKRTLQKVMRNSIIIRIMLIPFAIVSLINGWFIWVFVYAVLESTISLFFLPANDALVPKIVDKDNRANANSYMKLLFVVVHTLGFMMATFFIKSGIGFTAIFLFCAVSLVCSCILVKNIKPFVRNESEEEKPFVVMFKEGISYLKKQKNIRNLIFLLACAWIVASSIDLVIIAYLLKVAKTGTEDFSFVAAATFLGMTIGAISAPYLYYKFERKWFFILPLFVYGVVIESMNIFANWIFILPFFVLGGIMLGIFEVYFTTYLQDETDSDYLARIFSIHTMILSSGPLFGFLFIGLIMKYFSLINVIHTISVFLLLLGVCALIFFPLVNKGKKMNEDDKLVAKVKDQPI